eukprot:gene18441-5921_t
MGGHDLKKTPDVFCHVPVDTLTVRGARADSIADGRLFRYSVNWREELNIEWATRWDVYLRSADAENKIHWFSIINSLLILLFLSGMVGMILLRALHKDFNRYNDPENVDEAQEETGWKLVHGDVFRAPQMSAFLAVNAGTGMQ